MNALRQNLLSLFDQMTFPQQQQLLETACQILHPVRSYTGRELMALPAEERERLVAEARARNEHTIVSLKKEFETTN